MRPFVVDKWHFHVAGRALKKSSSTQKSRFSRLLSMMIAICVKLAGVGLNICECAGKAKSHSGRRASPHSCLAMVL